eukprot:80704-Alexandrium_andersonii.AAC.1
MLDVLDESSGPFPPCFVANYSADYEHAQSMCQEAMRAVCALETLRGLDPSHANGRRRNGVRRPAHFSDSDFYAKLAEDGRVGHYWHEMQQRNAIGQDYMWKDFDDTLPDRLKRNA